MSSKLVEFLYPLPEMSQSPASLVRWWEARRPAFNAIVGTTGVVTLGAVHLLAWLPPNPWGLSLMQELPIIITYGVLANVMYSGGSLAEWAVRKLQGAMAPRPGPALFRMGLTFAVGLTLFPIALAGLDWLVRIARYWLR